MMSRLLAAAFATTLLGSAQMAHAATNLISDGDFNNSNSGYQTVYAGSSIPLADGSPGAWSVDMGSVDLIGGYWNSPSGPTAASGGTNGSVDLDGNSPGQISQTFFVSSPGRYQLSFDLSGNPDGGAQTVSVSTNETGVSDPTYTYNVPPGDSRSLIYQAETETFYAFGPTTLTFTSNTPGYYGPVIGNVAVSAIPEPATWALMLIGVGGIGLAFRQAKRRHGFRFKDAFAI